MPRRQGNKDTTKATAARSHELVVLGRVYPSIRAFCREHDARFATVQRWVAGGYFYKLDNLVRKNNEIFRGRSTS